MRSPSIPNIAGYARIDAVSLVMNSVWACVGPEKELAAQSACDMSMTALRSCENRSARFAASDDETDTMFERTHEKIEQVAGSNRWRLGSGDEIILQTSSAERVWAKDFDLNLGTCEQTNCRVTMSTNEVESGVSRREYPPESPWIVLVILGSIDFAAACTNSLKIRGFFDAVAMRSF